MFSGAWRLVFCGGAEAPKTAKNRQVGLRKNIFVKKVEIV